MKSYRIIKRKYLNKVKFVVEKRIFGFLWWYKFLNTEFDTYNDAAQAIHEDADDPKEEVVADIIFTGIDPIED